MRQTKSLRTLCKVQLDVNVFVDYSCVMCVRFGEYQVSLFFTSSQLLFIPIGFDQKMFLSCLRIGNNENLCLNVLKPFITISYHDQK